MFKLLKTILKNGEATVKYPFAPLEVPNDFRGKPELDAAQCISCGACARACPANAIVIENDTKSMARTWELSVARCIYCGRCEEVCPTKSIRLGQNFELAVTCKSDLYEQATTKIATCISCEKPFAPQKVLDYTLEVLEHNGMSQGDLEGAKQRLATCPECRRKGNMLDASNVFCSAHIAVAPQVGDIEEVV